MADLETHEIYEQLSAPETPEGWSRRRFIQAALAVGGAALAAPYVDMGAAFAASPLTRNDGILVVITMAGGCDSLNMVIPAGDSNYYAKRGGLAIKQTASLPITPDTALHPALKSLQSRYNAGNVAVVRGVAVPNPDLSHFTSVDTWMRGSADIGSTTGWLGRYLDGLGRDNLRGAAVGSSCPQLLVGATTQATAVPTSSGGSFGANRSNASDARMYDAMRLFAAAPTGLGPLGDQVAAIEQDTIDEAGQIASIYNPAPTGGSLTKQLTLAARLINANLGIRVLNVTIGGFDTHENELGSHTNLFTDFDAAIDAFYATLDPGWANAVALMTWSEFGRRVSPNNGGTDHGTAASLFVIGNGVKGGLYGQMPSLTSLDRSGNLIGAVDYRSYYTSVLEGWLAADAGQVLGGSYENLQLFAAGPVSSAPSAPGAAAPPPISIPAPAPPGYWIATADGHVYSYGRDAQLSTSGLKSPVVTMVATASKRGGVLVCKDGTVKAVGDGRTFGSMAAKKLNGPIKDMKLTPSGNGYWLLGSDGGIFAFGDAQFFGSTGNIRLNQPVVGMAATPSGRGYWLVASDGGIFAYGDARFYGSTGSIRLNQPIVGMAATASGRGYWLVAADGGVFAFGDAKFHGSTGGINLSKPIVSMTATDSGNGYWFVASDGGVFAFGDAGFHGSLGGSPPVSPVVAIAS
jgi:uncharacterized protein (DUF1501 family)